MTTGGYNLISADSHVIEPPDLFEKGLPSGLQDRAPRLETADGRSAWVLPGAAPVPLPGVAAAGSSYRLQNSSLGESVTFDEVLPAMYDPAERIRAQDTDGVDAEVIYPFPALWDAVKASDDDELKLGCARAYNDWIAGFSAHSPNRLVGLGKIPTSNRDDAVKELTRCVTELNLRGVILDAWPGGSAEPGDPEDDVFWQTANDLDVPLSIHYTIGAKAVTAPPGGVWPGLVPPAANPILLGTVYAGIFDRAPNLRMVLAHANAGWLHHWLEFMDAIYIRQVATRPYHLPDPDAVPSEYVRRHFWFTFHQDTAAVKNRAKIGPAHLLWASHFPFDSSNWPDNRQQAINLADLANAEDRPSLLAENAARLYKLPGYEAGFSSDKLEEFTRLVTF
jgi:predicted TIM-barrel fold metal-dependent hydrolase